MITVFIGMCKEKLARTWVRFFAQKTTMKRGGIGMLVTEYAKNVSEFQINSLKVYGLVMGLVGDDRVRREGGYAFISYKEIWEGGFCLGMNYRLRL
jgi:hypothetical protein